MTTEEPRRGDQVMFGKRVLLIDILDVDNGTKLSDGNWICASHLIHVGPRRWQYTPKDPNEMTIAELVFEHHKCAETLLKTQVHNRIRVAILPRIEKYIEQAADDITQHVMQEVYRTPPRLMGKDTGTA